MVEVTSVGSSGYTLTASLRGLCTRARSSNKGARAPDMALEYGGSGEPWKKLEAPCGSGFRGDNRTRTEATLNGNGRLGGDRVVHLRAGAWGGYVFGVWGWSDRIRVTV